MRIHPVHSLDIHALEPYRTLREKTHHWRDGFFVAEGEKVLQRLLESDAEIVSVLLSPAWLDTLRDEFNTPRFESLDVYVASDELLETIVGMALHKRLLAIGRIPDNPALADLSRAGGLHVALEGIADAENMGAIIRNCAAFGVDCLLTGKDSTHPWLRRSVRVSMGTILSLRTHRSASIVETLGTLRREHAWTVIGSTPRGGDTAIHRLQPHVKGPICLVFGSEGHGLSQAALAACDALFSIPMRGNVDSLNVANAVAVALYALRDAIPNTGG